MQWVLRTMGQAGDRAAQPVHSGAVVNLVVNDRRSSRRWCLVPTGGALPGSFRVSRRFVESGCRSRPKIATYRGTLRVNEKV